MRLEAKKYLFDMQQAAALLTQFTAGKGFADYAPGLQELPALRLWPASSTRGGTCAGASKRQ